MLHKTAEYFLIDEALISLDGAEHLAVPQIHTQN